MDITNSNLQTTQLERDHKWIRVCQTGLPTNTMGTPIPNNPKGPFKTIYFQERWNFSFEKIETKLYTKRRAAQKDL